MKKQRPLWEPKYRIEAAFRRRLLAIVRKYTIKQARHAGSAGDIIRILRKITESGEYKSCAAKR
ncbi:MAG TPA: hypothetical protein DHV71_02435 [Acidaminococcaceae bacterium]|nr:hypothetical protein [Acidaminococcaceae bacterium]